MLDYRASPLLNLSLLLTLSVSSVVVGHIFDLYGSLSPGAITLLKVNGGVSYPVLDLTSGPFRGPWSRI